MHGTIPFTLMETLISLLIGISLSAAAGFRLLVPFLVMSAAALFGHLPITPDLDWVGTYPALEALGVAVVVETLIYYIPWLDHLLDAIALPASILTGTLITASFGTDLNPFLQWSLAIIAGGGTAGAVKGLTGLSRLTSTGVSGGLTNFIVATVELVGAAIISILAIALPKLTFLFVVLLIMLLAGFVAYRWWRGRGTKAIAG